MEMPKPTDAHKKLERIVGSWSGEERLSPSPWDPKGGLAVGRVQNRRALDGFAVVQEYEQERNGVISFRGHGVLRWDPKESCYIMYWFDSMGMPPNEFKGQFEGDVLTMIQRASMGLFRATWDLSAPDSYAYRMDASQDGTQWQPFMEGRYVRQK